MINKSCNYETVHNNRIVCPICFKYVDIEPEKTVMSIKSNLDEFDGITMTDADRINERLRQSLAYIFDSSFKCNCGARMMLLDKDMYSCVKNFSSIGLYTEFSCIGNSSGSVPYISFMQGINVIDRLFDILFARKVISNKNVYNITHVSRGIDKMHTHIGEVNNPEYEFLKYLEFTQKGSVPNNTDILYVEEFTEELTPDKILNKIFEILNTPK